MYALGEAAIAGPHGDMPLRMPIVPLIECDLNKLCDLRGWEMRGVGANGRITCLFAGLGLWGPPKPYSKSKPIKPAHGRWEMRSQCQELKSLAKATNTTWAQRLAEHFAMFLCPRSCDPTFRTSQLLSAKDWMRQGERGSDDGSMA